MNKLTELLKSDYCFGCMVNRDHCKVNCVGLRDLKIKLKTLLIAEIEKIQTIATSTNGTSLTIALSKQEVKQAIEQLFSDKGERK